MRLENLAPNIDPSLFAEPQRLEVALAKSPSCRKLKSYWHFKSCGFGKAARECSEPHHFGRCPLPKHDLRNGRLNQTAYSLYFWIRDVADSDLVGWIDDRLRCAAALNPNNPVPAMREAVVAPLRNIFGAADKVLQMSLASILLAAHDRPLWNGTGGSMIAIDSLVHAWLARSGILANLKGTHPYGPRCYGPNGCAEILEKIAGRIDARQFNRSFPARFPRFIQFALWRYCAQEALGICNANRIRKGCELQWCQLYPCCARQRTA